MPTRIERVTFPGSSGDLLAARLDLPIVLHAFDEMDFPVTPHRPEDLRVLPFLPSAPLRPAAGWAGRLERVG